MRYEDALKLIADSIDHRFANHQFCDTPESKSWFLRDPAQGCHYAYSVTWMFPGTLQLAGDIGELTLTHYHAMPSWIDAVLWLTGNNDHDYHLSKSNAQQEFDLDGTLQVITEHLTEVARDADIGGYQYCGYGKTPQRQQIGSFDMGEVFVAQVNPEFLDDLRSRMEDGGEREAAEICSALGMDDYYGSRDWPHQRLFQMAALYKWAALVADTEEFKTELARRQARNELRRQIDMLNRRMKHNNETVVGVGDFQKHI